MAGTRWRVFVLIAAGSVIYLNTLSNPFVLDDEGSVVNNQQIRTLFSPAVLNAERELPTAGRPLANLTFAVNYALGGLNPAGYHAVNIAIHVTCALLLFFLARRLIDPDAAFALALLWVVHPLNSEGVSYVTQRTESLMAMFYLLTLYAAARAAEGARAGRWQTVAIAACALGMASKETMVTAPLMVVLLDRLFLYGSFVAACRVRWRLYAGLAASWLLLAVLLSTSPRSLSAGLETGVSSWTYLLNQAPLIVRYLGLTLWPSSLVANYGAPLPLTLAGVLPSFLLVATLLVLSLVALRNWPRAGFLGCAFFLLLAPASSVIPIATEVGAERRMYLASAAVIALIVVAAMRVLRDVPPRARAAVFGGVAMALAAVTVMRNEEYRSQIVLAETSLARYPAASTHHLLAEALIIAGRREEAMAHLWQAVPAAPRAHYTLGVELAKDERWPEAIAQLEQFVAKQPRLVWVVDAHGLLGTAYAALENWPAAIREFQAVLVTTPNNPLAHEELADALLAAERYDEAIPHYRRYLAVVPKDVTTMNQLGIALASSGQLDEAILVLRDAAAIDPHNSAVQQNLALAAQLEQELRR